MSALFLKYVEVASNFSASVQMCCARETRELCPFAENEVRRWTRCPNIFDEQGARVSPIVVVAPYPGNAKLDRENNIHRHLKARPSLSK